MTEIHPYILQFLLLIFLAIESFIVILTLKEKLSFKLNVLKKINFFILSVSFLGCLLAYLSSDVRYIHVFQNSHPHQAWYMKIASIWSHHETSFYFWFCVFYFSNYLLNIKNKSLFHIYSFLLMLFIVFEANPFAISLHKLEQGSAKGLNPLLYDLNMVWHPPLLYLGQALTFRIFSKSISNSAISKHDILAPFFILMTAIATGALWAFTQLGWGGFWFWDPVETLSILPWFLLLLIMHITHENLHHRPYIYQLPFLSMIFSAALIRSGIINSVHSFSHNQSCFWFMLGMFLGTSALILVSYFKSFHEQNKPIQLWGPIYVVLGTIVLLLFSVLHDVITLNSLNEIFYHKALTPIWIFANLYLTYYFFKRRWLQLGIKFKLLIFISLFILGLSLNYFFFHHLKNLYAFLALSSVINILIHLCELRKKFVFSLSHIGFACILLGLSLHSQSPAELLVNLKHGEHQQLGAYTFLLSSNKVAQSPFLDKRILEIQVSVGEKKVILRPQELFFHSSKLKRYQADYKIIGFDVIMIPHFDTIPDTPLLVKLEFAHKYGLLWIWFGFSIMSFAIIFQMMRNLKLFANCAFKQI